MTIADWESIDWLCVGRNRESTVYTSKVVSGQEGSKQMFWMDRWGQGSQWCSLHYEHLKLSHTRSDPANWYCLR